jgi:hypothetical protein
MIQATTRVESSTTTPLEWGPQHGVAMVRIWRWRAVDGKRRLVNGERRLGSARLNLGQVSGSRSGTKSGRRGWVGIWRAGRQGRGKWAEATARVGRVVERKKKRQLG